MSDNNTKPSLEHLACSMAGSVCLDKGLPASDDLWDIVHKRFLQYGLELTHGNHDARRFQREYATSVMQRLLSVLELLEREHGLDEFWKSNPDLYHRLAKWANPGIRS